MTRSIVPARSTVFAALALAAFALSATWSQPALAKAGKASSGRAPARKKAIALGTIDGRKSSDVRGWVRTALKSGFDITDAEGFRPKGDEAGYMKMAADLGVEAIITGKVQKNRVVLSIRDGADGNVISKIELAGSGAKLKAAIDKRLSKKVYAAFGMTDPAEQARRQAQAEEEAEEDAAEDEDAAEEDEGEEEEDLEAGTEEGGDESSGDESEEEAEEPEPAGPTEPVGSPFELSAGVGFSKRTFSFHDTLTQRLPMQPVWRPLRDYQGGLDVSILLRGELYPASLLKGQGFATNIGIAAGFEYAIPSTTIYKPTTGGEQKLHNNAQEWYLGLRIRVPMSKRVRLGFLAAYGQQKYIVKGDEANALVPDVSYRYLRPAIDLREDLGKLFLEARVGARLVLGAGELERADLWFENVGGHGVDAMLSIGYSISRTMSLTVGGRLVRYGFDFNPIPDNARWVAGGAVDQYVGGFATLTFRMPGKEPVVDAATE